MESQPNATLKAVLTLGPRFAKKWLLATSERPARRSGGSRICKAVRSKQTRWLARYPLDEIASSRLQDDGHDKDCLIPEDWRVAHGSNWNNLRGYRNVRVFRDDVLRAFPTAVSKLSDARHGNEEIEGRHPDEQPQQPPDDQPQQPRVGTRPTRERASRALQALYPNGVPDQVTLSNAKLFRAVGDWLKDQKLEDVSDPTILRAAGRRK